MNGRFTLALLALFAALAAFVYFVEQGEPSAEDVKKASKLLVPALKPKERLELRLTRPREPSVTALVLRRASGDAPWRLVAPLEGAADTSEAEGILSSLEFTNVTARLPAADAAATGLATPRLVLEIGAVTGGAAVKVEVGDEDVTGKLVYARASVGGAAPGDVAQIQAYSATRLDRRLDDLRDRALFTIDRWSVSRITFEGADGRKLSFKKDGDPWLLEAPESDTADRTKVEDLLRALHDARAKAFVAEPADEAALAQAGLAKPALRATLSSGVESQTIEIGGETLDEAGLKQRFARRSDRQAIVRIEARAADACTFDVEGWRSKNLLPPIRDQITVLEVRRPGAPAPLARLERVDQVWRYTAPVSATADMTAVEELLRELQDAQVSETVAKKIEDRANFGLDDRSALLVSVESPKEKRGFRLGRASAKENAVLVERDGRDAALEVVLPKAGTLRAPYPALRSLDLLALSAEDVTRLDVVKKGGKGRAYVKVPEKGWTTPEGSADAASLDALAADLVALRAERILTPPADLQGTGLAEPWLIATLAWKDEKALPVVLELGKVLPEGGSFHARLRRGEETTVFALRKALVDALDKEHVAAPPAPSATSGSGASAGASGSSGASGDASGASGAPPEGATAPTPAGAGNAAPPPAGERKP